MPKVVHDGHTYEAGCEMVDVTSNHRPDTNWTFTDAKGHVHQWYDGDMLAQGYSPSKAYTTPTLVWVKDGEEYWGESEDPHPFGHLECKECGEHIQPGYCADSHRMFIPGLRWFTIDGEPVAEREFLIIYRKALEKEKS